MLACVQVPAVAAALTAELACHVCVAMLQLIARSTPVYILGTHLRELAAVALRGAHPPIVPDIRL